MAFQKPFEIAGTIIQPGTRQTVDMPVTSLYTHTPLTLPIHVIHGKKNGPRLFVSAAIHGDELNGIEIIRRLIQLKFIRRLRGTLVAVPIVNLFGFLFSSRYLPDRRDLNRVFPGSKSGSLTSQLAYLFLNEIVERCTHGIDLHTGAIHRPNLPQIRADLGDSEVMKMAKGFAAPVALDARERDGSLRFAARDIGIPVLLYEGGEALRFDEVAINVGVRGVVGVMQAIGMLSQKRPYKPRYKPIISWSSYWLRSPSSGILHSTYPLGYHVGEGKSIGCIRDPLGENEVPVVTTKEGIVIGRTLLPVVNQGDGLFHIADVEDLKRASQSLEQFHEEYQEEYEEEEWMRD